VLQGASLVDRAIGDGSIFDGRGWRWLMDAASAGATLHLLGLLSDGGVHSRLDQLLALLGAAARAGAGRIRLHVLTDGRDVPDGSSLDYIDQLEAELARLRQAGCDARIASGGGRMHVTMDRYEADWSIVERGWRTHVLGDARGFESARAAVETLRREDPEVNDQYLPPFVIVEDGEAIGTIGDGDAVLCFNFRGDRAIEISRAFTEAEFEAFDRIRHPEVRYAGMMEYDGDRHIPGHYLVEPPTIAHTAGEALVGSGVRSFACSETQKFGHMTYFWNGNRSGRFDESLETYLEIPSHSPPFDRRPEMQALAIAEAASDALDSGAFDFLRINIANGDMVGHTGDLRATIAACEAVDRAVGLLRSAVQRCGAILLLTADHGNADDMAQRDRDGRPAVDAAGRVIPRTSHTLAPVPLVVSGPGLPDEVRLRSDLPDAGLANVTATYLNLLGFETPAGWEPGLLSFPD
jgi:2,3-bisphosphoglycerate-independent phosphoglycerate mutase